MLICQKNLSKNVKQAIKKLEKTSQKLSSKHMQRRVLDICKKMAHEINIDIITAYIMYI